MDARRAGIAMACLAVGLGAVHLWLAGTLELSPDEAYYWTWSRSLALAYPDHPPLVAWLVRAGTAVAGDTELGVRWPFVLLGTALVPLVFALARRASLRPGLALLVAAAAGTSLLGSAGALLATPETPLVFGWTLGLLGLVAVATGGSAFGGWALVAGGTAVALLSKLTGVLLPVVVLLWLLGDRGRPWRGRLAPRLALLAGIAAAAPALLADLWRPHPAAAFQAAHGLWAPGLGPLARLGNLGAWLGGQLGLLSPLIAVGVLVFLVRRRDDVPPASALRLSALVPWSLFGCAALLAPPEVNWPACAHVGALLGAGLAVQAARDRRARWSRGGWVAAALGLQVAVSLLVHVHLVHPFLPLETAGPEPFAGPTDPAARLHGWRELARAVRREQALPLGGSYGVRSELEFYRPNGSGAATGARPPREKEWVEILWIDPREGASLPGRVAPGEPPGRPSDCVPVPADAAQVDGGLLHPSAPVRIVLFRCPARSGNPR